MRRVHRSVTKAVVATLSAALLLSACGTLPEPPPGYRYVDNTDEVFYNPKTDSFIKYCDDVDQYLDIKIRSLSDGKQRYVLSEKGAQQLNEFNEKSYAKDKSTVGAYRPRRDKSGKFIEGAKPGLELWQDFMPENGNGGDCFTSDTLVLMDDGTLKRIVDVNTGDRVSALDVQTGSVTSNAVTDLYCFYQDHYYLINGKLKVTAHHPFFTTDGTCRKASELKIGDRICSDNKPITITSIERIRLNHVVFNFRVANTHSYFVSPDGRDLYLVHNK